MDGGLFCPRARSSESGDVQSPCAAQAFQVHKTLKQPRRDGPRVVAISDESLRVADRDYWKTLVRAKRSNRNLQGSWTIGIAITRDQHDATFLAQLPKVDIECSVWQAQPLKGINITLE
jgi:hypothetical protein